MLHKKIQHILKAADLPKNLSDELQRELESYFYEKELDLRFAGLRGEKLQKQLEEDFGADETVGKTLQMVHQFSLYYLFQAFMKKAAIALPIVILFLLFWAPWMADDGGENVIWEVTARPEVQAELTQYNLDPDGPDWCDGVSSRWAPFGRTVEYCDHASWYVPFWG